MREPPARFGDSDLLEALRRDWPMDLDAVEHLPVGFGAHHWAASRGGQRLLFVTLDQLGPRHSSASLEAAYAGAAVLAASGLEFVLPSLPTAARRFTTPFADGALSCTPWREGAVVGEGAVSAAGLAANNAAMLARLHAADPPREIPQWRPRVGPDFAAELRPRLAEPWPTGPYGEPARAALTAGVGAINRWTTRYWSLTAQAYDRPWVATHGEPHTRNQLRTGQRILLVDWESLALAPRERDLRPLVDSGFANLVDADDAMLELFDLEWRLDEIAQYSDWFAQPHTGTESDAVAYAGLVHELDRPDWSTPLEA
jgi:spectinomycin phosphotransferase